jgi:hypothetical protein
MNNNEEEWTLYLLTHVYARDEVHAQLRAQSWIALHVHSSHLEVTAYPEGFSLQTRDLPGKITIQIKEGYNGK